MRRTQNDPVNHPSHYTSGKIEVIDFIEDQKLPYHLGNVIKYICRAGKKDPTKTLEDLEKAQWYLDRYICWLEEQKMDEADPLDTNNVNMFDGDKAIVFTGKPYDTYLDIKKDTAKLE